MEVFTYYGIMITQLRVKVRKIFRLIDFLSMKAYLVRVQVFRLSKELFCYHGITALFPCLCLSLWGVDNIQ